MSQSNTGALISADHRSRYLHHYASKGPVEPRPNVWLPTIEEWIRDLGAQSVIDYGCGAARGVSRFCSVKVHDYDPGVLGLDTVPQPADLVVSVHMLEHVEPEHMDRVIAHIKSLALKAALVVVSCEPSTKVLTDGYPWHCVVRPYDWWWGRLGGLLLPTIKGNAREFATLIQGSDLRRPA